MVDIHSHIIPFVDDGSKSIEDSIEMIKHSISIGVSTIIATPHHRLNGYEASVDTIKENFNLLVKKVKEENLNVTLLLGQEILYKRKEHIFDLLKEKKLLTMNDSNYILLEFDFIEEPDEDIAIICENAKANGYVPIIAHAERYSWLTYTKLLDCIDEGALVQVNASSLLGKEGFKIKKVARRYVADNLVSYIASDMHSFRKSLLDKAYKLVDDDKLFKGVNLL